MIEKIAYYLLLLLMTIIGSVAAMFLKKAASRDLFVEMLKNKEIYIGGMLYVFSAVIDIFLLRKLDYSIVVPLSCLTYIWTMIFSKKYFNEKINIAKLLGVAFIIVGVILIIT